MDNSRKRLWQFLEKEIKTYQALARFLAKKGIAKHTRGGQARGLTSPTFYIERMKEARHLANELKKTLDHSYLVS
jgi:hypothetical protein